MNVLNLFSTDPILGIVFLLAVIIAVTIHECAHAWTADKLGDDTPYLQGRVTLDPRAHLDPLGSLLFILFGFGWGKPVIYNPARLSRRVDELYIALAGPASNLLLALFLNIIIVLIGGQLSVFASFLALIVQINIILAAFNMIPVPPLDGSSIVAYFFPEYRSLIGSQIGGIAILLLVFLPIGGGNIISQIVSPISYFFTSFTTLFGLLG